MKAATLLLTGSKRAAPHRAATLVAKQQSKSRAEDVDKHYRAKAKTWRFSGDTSAYSLGSLAEALEAQWKRYRKKLKRCQQKFSEKAVHDSRVETRRLLATVQLLGVLLPRARIKKARRALKEHLDTFDALRDTHVQLRYVVKMLRGFPAARPFHGYLLKCEKHYARETRKRIKRVKTGRLAMVIADCAEELRERRQGDPAAQTQAAMFRALERAYQRVRQMQKQVNARNTVTIHRTRIAFKKFRYLAELLARIWPGLRAPKRGALRQYQAMMGDIQDVEVLLAAFDKFLRGQPIAEQPARALREELLRRRQWLIERYLQYAGQLRGFKPGFGD